MSIFQAYPALFPVYFAALWLVVTTLLGVLTGWFGVMRRYPDTGEEALATLRAQSGAMGLGVNMNSILNLSPCSSGLRIGMMRLFGPFCRPFLVPWGELSAVRSSFMLFPMVKLTFGRNPQPALWLYPRTWERLQKCAPMLKLKSEAPVPFSNAALFKGAILQWLIITTLAASYFYFAPRIMMTGAHGPPLSVCIGFPAIFFGFAQIVNVLIQLRRR